MNSRLTASTVKIILNLGLLAFVFSSHAQTMQEAINAARNKDYDKACPAFQKNAQNNDSKAMSALALCYFNGHHFQRNLTEALFWARKAADMNDPAGLGIAGTLYFRGVGGSRDVRMGVAYLERAVAQGYVPAFQPLGEAYLTGTGANQDYAKARTLLERATLRESARAGYQLGRIYEEGLGATKDLHKAIDEYKKALQVANPQENEDLNNPGKKLKDAIEDRIKGIENNSEFSRTRNRQTAPNTNAATNLNPIQPTQANRQATQPSASNSDNLKIFRDKCVELGFKIGTETFGECVLRLSK